MDVKKKRAIITVGVSQARQFGPYHKRFQETMGGDGVVKPFACADSVTRYETSWPPQSPSHLQVHYGFKIYAVKEALKQGYTSVLWLDVSAYAVAPLEPLWKEIEREGHYLAGAPEITPSSSVDRLGSWTSDHTLAHFGVSRDDAMFIPLLSGTCFGLDLTNSRTMDFYERILSYAVPEHFNGTHKSGIMGAPPQEEGKRMSNDPRCQGHRSDECYMSLVSKQLGMKSSLLYFAGGMGVRPDTVLRSGYNIEAVPEPIDAIPSPLKRGFEGRPPHWPKLEEIHEHTIDTALLTPGGFVLDAGCRNFGFSKALAERGCKVIALDADPTIEDPKIPGVSFLHLALSSKPGVRSLVMSSDPQARHLDPGGDYLATGERVAVAAVTIDHITDKLAEITGEKDVLSQKIWDVVKLDIEGSEYGVLQNWPGPIAKQISIEFHEHVAPKLPEVYDAIFKHLSQWYVVVQHEKTAMHGAGMNYWDSLLVLKAE